MSPEEDTSHSSSSSSSSSPPHTSHFIGRKEDIIKSGRVTKLVNGCRDVLVLYHQEQFYAMDMHCYHAGGALQNGDIEEFNGQLCIVCPWHKYKITLEEGEGLYQAVDDPTAKPLRTHWRSKGVKQRIHKVTEVNGDVFVTLNDSSEAIESDVYQTEKYRTLFQKNQPKPRPRK
ncbi:Rieske domain-containing protein-like [Cheilinus undulatus]|uniref:Rieske domain-containing protein-like n=1 Tax=Cheilinus undulatus TaxID=241271 RepID=UPI001BD59060|nr:Rieske domain-containing protein-like [Cheilinus undulatus]XP_041644006.1 Rieske domain-containing protein-like [Cheilinus undulatus]XP_041644007.1 Rieske domain-containing protein-like [Cheilinus undulatus]